jgi:hypothetical protein
MPGGPQALTTGTRYAGALALLAVGADHLEQDTMAHYSVVPTIGTLFVLNFAAAVVVACGLALPAARWAGRAGRPATILLALGGIAIAAGSAMGLLLSENGGIFGFMEDGYRPAIILSLALDGTAALLLVAHLLLVGLGGRGDHRRRGASAARLYALRWHGRQ